jgi:hypothetical protein
MRTIETKHLITLEDFQSLKKWDYVACKFKRNILWIEWFKFWVFEIYQNIEFAKEIVIDKKRNIYFNYEMFLNGESNLEDILLIK